MSEILKILHASDTPTVISILNRLLFGLLLPLVVAGLAQNAGGLCPLLTTFQATRCPAPSTQHHSHGRYITNASTPDAQIELRSAVYFKQGFLSDLFSPPRHSTLSGPIRERTRLKDGERRACWVPQQEAMASWP
jgi:hypothetical protein